MSAFERLTPALQYQIAYTLGFKQLRPVQEMTIPVVLDGHNCVVLAPTAGGKTEAAFFPVLSAMDAHDWKPVSVIYLSPIRALLNNQEERVSRYAATIGRRVFKWHGDTPPTARKRFLRAPADILLTTPESLEAMLMSPRVPARGLFAGLQSVILDEVHAFADDDRGAHLSAILERLSRYCGRDIQRIGLSATVGNPEEILDWIAGRSQRPGVVVSPPRPANAPDLKIDYVGSIQNAALVTAQLHPGKKRLVFVDSRRGVEDFARFLRANSVETYVAHGSLAASARRDAERAFAEGGNCVIVATSALELGIDVGDLDHVLQFDAPDSVSSFLQRMGRTGRRPGTTPNCTFLAASDRALWQAAAIVGLYREGWIEPVSPSRRATHILAHQLMALCIQEDGVPIGSWWAWLDGATPFKGLSAEDRQRLVAFMLEKEILARHDDGRYWLGPEGERKFGRANFSELYAVFSTPRLLTVVCNREEVGSVDASFLQTIETEGPEKAAFSLGGRAWRILHIDWPRGVCTVKPADDARAPRWSGRALFLEYTLVQKMRAVVLADDIDPAWSKRAVETMTSVRAEHAFLRELGPAPFVQGDDGITWWTFAGGRANTLLARMVEAELGGRCVVRNLSITCKEQAAASLSALRNLVHDWSKAARPDYDDARKFAVAANTRVSKFEPCLPPDALEALVADVVFDVENAQRIVRAAVSSEDLPRASNVNPASVTVVHEQVPEAPASIVETGSLVDLLPSPIALPLAQARGETSLRARELALYVCVESWLRMVLAVAVGAFRDEPATLQQVVGNFDTSRALSMGALASLAHRLTKADYDSGARRALQYDVLTSFLASHVRIVEMVTRRNRLAHTYVPEPADAAERLATLEREIDGLFSAGRTFRLGRLVGRGADGNTYVFRGPKAEGIVDAAIPLSDVWCSLVLPTARPVSLAPFYGTSEQGRLGVTLQGFTAGAPVRLQHVGQEHTFEIEWPVEFALGRPVS